MLRFIAHPLILAFIIAGISVTPARAQFTDVQVSPIEPVLTRFPLDIRIQSGATIGDRSLIVWGSTINASDNSISNVLYMQMLQGDAAVGTERIITSPAARPYGFVRAIASETIFIIIWNDRRDGASGIYAIKIDQDGNAIGDEWRISSGSVATGGAWELLLIGDPEKGQLLVWPDRRPGGEGAYAVRIDSLGDIHTPELFLGNVRKGLKYSALPGIAFLSVTNDRGYMVDNTGRINPRRIPVGRLDSINHIGKDMSLVLLSGKTLLWFRSIFDLDPIKKISIPAIDTAFMSTRMLWRDEDDTVRVYFHRSYSVPTHYASYTHFTGYRVNVTRDGAVSDTMRVLDHSWYNDNDGASRTFRSYDGAIYRTGCDNTSRIVVFWTISATRVSTPYRYYDTTMISIDNNGKYGDETGFIPSCQIEPDAFVRRHPDTAVSRVEARIGDLTLTLSAETATGVINHAQRSPMLLLQDGGLFCGWRHGPDNNIRYVMGPWNPSDGPIQPADSLVMGDLGPCDGGPVISSSYSGYERLLALDGSVVVSGGGYVMTDVNRHGGPVTLFCGGYRLYSMDKNGWTRTFGMFEGPDNTYFRPPLIHLWRDGEVISHDPNLGRFIVRMIKMVDHKVYSSMLYSVAHDGDYIRLDSVAGDGLKSPVIPITEQRYLRLGNFPALMEYGQKLADYLMPAGTANDRYQRLMGNYFLRWGPTEISGDYHLDLFDLECHLLGSATLTLPGSAGVPFITQNHLDSSFAVVWCSSGRVHAIHLDKMLGCGIL